MRGFFCLSVALLLPAAARPQNALLSQKEAQQLFRRAVQLVESTAVAVPGLVRAAAPVTENARQSLKNLEGSSQNAALTYSFLENLRAYLALSNSLPKPYPFPEEGRKQFAELRDDVDRIESHFRALLEQKEAQVRSPDRDNLARYAEADEKLGPPSPNLPRVVFLGDSITDGWRLNEYFTGRDFVNRGISGQITGEMLARMKQDVIDLKPKAVLVLAGTNDIARGVPLTTIKNNLTMIADLANAYKIVPLLASILPVSDYHKDQNPAYEQTKRRPPATIMEMNRWIQDFCGQRKYVYVDYYSRMVDSAGFLQAELSDDGLHPNAAGYRIMAPIALEAIGRVITEQKPAAEKKRRWRIIKQSTPPPTGN